MHFMRDGLAIIPTAPHQPRNGDVQFPEPEAVAVLAPGRAEGEFLLFCRERDAAREIWDGRRQGIEGAREHYAADQSFPIGELDARLPELIENRAKVFVTMGRYADFDRRLIRWLGEVRSQRRAGVHTPGEFVDLGHTLHEMRVIKKKDEHKLMRKAAVVSAAAHRRAMRVCAPGMNECEVQAELECVFRRGGGEPAYPSIVAGGANACILHYTENNRSLADGEMLLIDAGAEIDCYAADITRTFPVNGVFSGAQRAVYEVVLAAQRAAIDAVRPERALSEYHAAACETLTDGLIDLGLLRGERNELIERGACSRFYMHRTGHWLGMDVHDVGDYKIDGRWRLLEPGMVVTVEPGLYISAAGDIDAKWHGIGVRIEDDILVTRGGNENLSVSAPKEIAEIEAVMAEGAE